MTLFLAAFVAVISAGVAYLLVRFQSFLPFLDRPNGRSSHYLPTPRSGGVAIATSLMAVGVFISFANLNGEIGLPHIGVSAAAAGFFLIGIADDYRSIPAWVRLLAQIGLAGFAVEFGRLSVINFAGIMICGIPVDRAAALVWIVGFVNVFNFMDGLDGLALGKALFGGLLIAGLGGPDYAILVAAAALGSLLLNFPPARIFLGDGGSYLLGFLLASACLEGGGAYSFAAKVLPFSSFIADSGLTLARRLFQGESILEAHRSHYYQRATNLGFSQQTVTLSDYALTLIGGLSGYILLSENSTAKIMIFALLIAAVFIPISLIGFYDRTLERIPPQS